MNNLELSTFGVEEMTSLDLRKVEGGFWQFVLGALGGGLIYDVYKAAAKACVDASIAGTYEGMPSHSFQH